MKEKQVTFPPGLAPTQAPSDGPSPSSFSASSCQSVQSGSSKYCKTSGFYCFTVTGQNYTITATLLGRPIGYETLSCPNKSMTAEFCPAGHFCPTSEIMKKCQPGYFCGEGSSDPISCQFGVLSCPTPGMSGPLGYSLFFCLIIMVSFCLWSYMAYAFYIVTAKEKKTQKETRHSFDGTRASPNSGE